MGVMEEVTYRSLVQNNRNFRLLWMGDIVSLFGDWFNTIAIYTLIATYTDSPFAMGLVFVIKMGSYCVASPLAGVIADRYNRRRLMIVSDLLRCVLVLGFLGVRDVSHLPWLYVLIALQMVLGSVFRPARSASLPNITTPRELLTANALVASTWSVLLALGAAIGGGAAAWLGTDVVFWLDSATYLLSALCIARMSIPQSKPDPRETQTSLVRTALQDIVAGWRYLVRVSAVGRMALAKSSWALGGCALVYMLTLLGEVLSPGEKALGIGILFAVRGLGTGIGPIVARAVFRNRIWWPTVMGCCTVLSGLLYATLCWIPWTLWVVIPIGMAHALSGANWVFSSVLLQERSEDKFRGRVFATDWVFLTLTNVVMVSVASLLLEYEVVSLREAYGVFSTLIVVAGVVWLCTIVPAEARALRRGD